MGARLVSLSRSTLNRIPFRTAALLVVFLAFVLRVYRLDAVGVDGDEAFSIHAAYSGLARILEITTTVEPHPPLFYAFLLLWYLVAGASELALRYPSVFANVLAIVFLFKVASLVTGRFVALFAAILFALNPYQVWYSQNVRMYTLAQLFGLVALYLALRALRQTSIRHFALYVAFMLLALYTHYWAIFLVIVASLVLLIGLWRQRKPRTAFVRWGVAQLVIAALYLPWLAAARRISLSYVPGPQGSADLLSFVRNSLMNHSVGHSMPDDARLPLALGFLAIGAAGVWVAARAGGEQPRWLRFSVVAGYALLPLLLDALVSLRRPMLEPRYLVVNAPAAFLALAIGVAGLARWGRPLGIAAGLFLLVTQTVSLGNYFFDRRYAKTDMPDGMKYVLTHARPGDAAVLDGWYQPIQYWYYNTLRFNDRVPPYLFPTSLPIEAEAASIPHQLDEIMAKHERVWLLDYGVQAHDPQQLVEAYLSRNYYPSPFERPPAFEGAEPGRAVYYTSARPNELRVTPLDVGFGEALLLQSLGIGATSVGPGEIVRVALSWRVFEATGRDYAVSWRLLDRAGRLVYQRDAGPASNFAPTRDWVPGTELVDRFGLPVPASLPPGDYALSILVYDRASGMVLEPRQNGQPPSGSTLQIAKLTASGAPPTPPVDDPHPSRRTDFAFGGLRLLGFDMEGGPLWPGQSAAARLHWKATDDIQGRELVMRLLTDRGQVLSEKRTRLGEGWFPSGFWPRGRAITSYADVPVPARAATGSYRLSLSLAAGGAGRATFSDFPTVAVVSRERSFAAPPISHPRAATFGGLVEMLGYDLRPEPDQPVRPGGMLGLTLYWRALREMDETYKIFTHLVGEDGRIYGQEDGTPLAGKAPTSSWVQGEVLTDRYDIRVHPEAPRGSYRLLVGFYEAGKGVRLKLSDGSGDSFLASNVIISSPGTQ